MKILYAASEATPFAKSGGLADVAGSLPKALVKDGVDARVIMPLYGDLKFRDKLEYVTNYSVPVGWRSQYCGLFKAEVNGVTYYFLDNEYYLSAAASTASTTTASASPSSPAQCWRPCSTSTLPPTSSTATTGRPLWCRCT